MSYTIYSKPSCPFCVRAKQLLDILGEEYTEINITEGDNRQALNEHLGYEARTVPQIWHESKHIGGYTDLVEYTK